MTSMGEANTPPAPSRVELNERQLEDFAWLLSVCLTPPLIRHIGFQVLGPLAEAANEGDDVQKVATATVKALAKEGRVADAVQLIRNDAHRQSRLMIGLNEIMQDRPLNSDEALHALRNKYEPFLSSEIIQREMPRVLRTVCAVALGGKVNQITGSGFLIGEDLVMTNFHVLDPFVLFQGGKVVANGDGKDIYFFFDYLSGPAPDVPPGAVRHKSIMVQAAEQNWLEFGRESLPYDGTPQADPHVISQYDYVVIRLRKAIGKSPARRGGGVERGWLTLPTAIDPFTSGKRILVFQHPETAPQQWDVGEYDSPDPSGTRFRYHVSSAHGSSGGAAVGLDGRLFALHNAEVRRQPNPKNVLNQGVRIDRIADDLAKNRPDLIQAPAVEDDSRLVWSLNDDLQNSQPIIGRRDFREKVKKMVTMIATERVMTVVGPANSGLIFSKRLLKRTVGSVVPFVEFSPDDLQRMNPGVFAQRLVKGLGIRIPDEDPVPKPKGTEMDSRWVRLDLTDWVARRVASDRQRDKSRFPAWVIIDTAIWKKDGEPERLLWADKLDDLILALVGVQDAGETRVNIAELRWLILAPSNAPEILGLRDVPRLEDDLTHWDYVAGFAECVAAACYSIDKSEDAKIERWESLAIDQCDVYTTVAEPRPPLPKWLANRVRGLIKKEAEKLSGARV
jgi:hypothetical protein